MQIFVGKHGAERMFEMTKSDPNYNNILVMCDNPDNCIKYLKLYPNAYVWNGWNEDKIEAFFGRARDRKDMNESVKYFDETQGGLLIVEVYGKLKSKSLQHIAMNLKSMNIRVRLTLNDEFDIEPCIREQASISYDPITDTQPQQVVLVTGYKNVLTKWFRQNVIGNVLITNYAISEPCTLVALKEDIVSTLIWAEKNYPFKTVYIISDVFMNYDVVSRVVHVEGTLIHEVTRHNYEEGSFIRLMKRILEMGHDSQDRTGTGTLSLFGHQLEFSLRNQSLPMMTTRKMTLKGVFEELMFYLKGETDAMELAKRGCKVWLANTTREELDKRGFQYMPVGDMGHSYGFSFRHYGGDYKTCRDDYTGVGFDQLTWLINEIRTNPNSRRLIITLLEPNYAHKAVLPPCLHSYQFYVRNSFLSCMMTQRSSDYFTAGPWNVLTGALLTYLIASVCDLKPDKLVWNIGDVHLYKNLISFAEEQIQRDPYPFPKISIKKRTCITDYEYTDISIYKYQSHSTIKPIMNV